MSIVRVTWGRRTAIGPDTPEELRTMTMDFGSARRAAAFVCDVLFVLEGREVSNAWSDKFYLVGLGKPRVQYESRTRDEYILVEYLPAKV